MVSAVEGIHAPNGGRRGSSGLEPEFNDRDRKRADWTAFQLSGERPIQQFERRWRCLHVPGANGHNITWELSAPIGRDFSLSLALSVAPAGASRRLGEALVFLNDEVELFVGR
jgi:hypothetical protein